MKRVALVTMVYNEPEYLPIWCSYYGSIFGADSCYIVDHGSDDGSTSKYPAFNVCRIPRSPKDNTKRTKFISDFCNALLTWYDYFIYVDVDEILVSANEKPLFDNIVSLSDGPYSACGFDIHHEISNENAFDPYKPITWQRRWARFSSSMCKVVASSRPIEWSPGFHSANGPLNFAELYLFHLRYFDISLGLKRLARTRSMQWAHENAGSHQRVGDDEFSNLMTRVARLPKIEDCDFRLSTGKVFDYVSLVKASEKDYRTSSYNIDLHIFGSELLQIPPSIVGLF
jgi:hypothetical protein